MGPNIQAPGWETLGLFIEYSHPYRRERYSVSQSTDAWHRGRCR
jgi:hypothetical protein